MATISTASIQTGQIVQAEHVTRIINALDGTASNNIIIDADLKQGSTSNTTNNSNSHAEGNGTTASGAYSHAEGEGSTASDDSSHAEGLNTAASGKYSHAEGDNTTASGQSSHAEGVNTIASGIGAHAEGYYTIAYDNYQTAVGRYNKNSNTSDYFVVGVGSAGGRLDGLGVNNTRTYISNSVYLPNLTDSPKPHVAFFDSTTKQIFYGSTSSLITPPAAPTRSIQFNDNNAFSGSADLIFDANGNLILNGNIFGNTTTGTNSFLAGKGTTGDAGGFFGDSQTIVGWYNMPGNLEDLFIVGCGTGPGSEANGFGIGFDGAEFKTYISTSLYLPTLTSESKNHVLTFDNTTKRVYYIASTEIGGIPGGTNKTIQFNSGSIFSGSANFTFDYVTNRMLLTGSMAISGSGNEVLTVKGSGSSQPITSIIGSQGTLFSVTDSLSGSLFSVVDISAQPIFEVFSDNTVIIGTSGTSNPPSLYVTKKLVTAASGRFTLGLGLIPTSSYDGAYFEYVAKSGSNSRSGYITSTWNGTNLVSSSITSSDIGDTTGLTTFMAISSSYIVLSGSANAANWTIKSIIRAI